MKKRTLLLFLMTVNLIPFSRANYSTDSLSYPIYGIDSEGTKIVTIKKSQQLHIAIKLLDLEKCKKVNNMNEQLISLMKDNEKDFEGLFAELETLKEKNSLLIQKKNKYIRNLEEQIASEKSISNSLKIEKDNIAKRERRKIRGWKIGNSILVGITITALTTAAILGAK